MNALDIGVNEEMKEAVHTVARDLCVLMGTYNGAALAYRLKRGQGWQWHLVVNAVIYLGAAYWEHGHVELHRQARDQETGS